METDKNQGTGRKSQGVGEKNQGVRLLGFFPPTPWFFLKLL